MRRFFLSLFGILFLSGCPGSVDDPTAFCLSDVCSPARVECVIQQTCATQGCHDSATQASSLDLQMDAIDDQDPDRLDVDALRTRLSGLTSVAPGCDTEPMIDAADSARSYFLAKLRNDPSICGNQMPSGSRPIAASDIECLSSWIAGDISASSAALQSIDGGTQ